MIVLLVYATYSGGTQSAAQIVEEAVKAKNHTITVKPINEVSFEELGKPDLTLLGSPSWDYAGKEGQPHEDFITFISKANGKILEGKKFAVFGLGDSSYMHFCGSVDHLEQFVTSVKGTLVGPSLRIDGFYYNLADNTEKLKTWTEEVLAKTTP